MLRKVLAASVTAAFLLAVAQAATMAPSARDKMTAPAQAAKMRACEQKAAQQNIKMHERSKFVMDCMKTK